MKPININPNNIFEPTRSFIPVILVGGESSTTVSNDTNSTSIYETIELFSLSNLDTKTFGIGTFHKLSFTLSGTALLEVDAQTQNISDTDYSLEYPRLNTQIVKITLGSIASLNGIVTK